MTFLSIFSVLQDKVKLIYSEYFFNISSEINLKR